MTAFIVLAREVQTPKGAAIELKDMGAIEREHLQPLAEVALEQGFDMMYEFSSKPDIAEVGRLAPNSEVSGMTNMTRLWVLGEDKL